MGRVCALLLGLIAACSLHGNRLTAEADESVASLTTELLGGDVVVPPTLLNVTVWPGDATLDGFVFPELSDGDYGIPALQQKPNFGIGISGGGLRATTRGLGWLRGLHMMGVMNKARYLAGASGGGLATAMVCYSDPSKMDKLLAVKQYVPPGKASLKAVKDLGSGSLLSRTAPFAPSFYQTLLERIAVQGVQEKAVHESAFARTLSLLVFNSLKLGLWNSTVTALGTRGGVDKRVREEARRLGLTVYTTDPAKVPYPLVEGAVLDSTDVSFFYPLEMTPLYYGWPSNFSGFNTEHPKGGGLMEPWAFNAEPVAGQELPQAGQFGPAQILVNSTYVAPLVGQVAVSGGILGVELDSWLIQAGPGNRTSRSNMAGMPFYRIMDFKTYTSELYPFGDGGYQDNEGLNALLRRKVQKLLLFYSTTDGIDIPKEQWAENNSGLSLPFGRCPSCYKYLGVEERQMDLMCQVFADEAMFDDLYDTFVNNTKAGRVNVWRANLTVIENKYMGVPGGWQVELMLVMNAVVGEWEEQLAPKTKALLQDSRTNPLTQAQAALHPLQTTQLVGYPFFPTGVFAYTKLAAGMLSQQATWEIMQLEEEIKHFVGGN